MTNPQRTILYIEDNPSNVLVVDRIVESLGHRLVVATNAHDGMEMLLKDRPDLVLMDVGLPDLDGLTATQQIRTHAGMDTLPIIAVTASAMTGDRERCLEAGCDDYIAKPFQMRTLIDMLRRYLA